MQFTTTLALLLSLTSATLAAESNKMARAADLAALEAADLLPRDANVVQFRDVERTLVQENVDQPTLNLQEAQAQENDQTAQAQRNEMD
ncbi:hypothetical protein HYALB_00006881 [Hymenoscyphus albidus]|uniref:Uncharacterized protein n=1 Tax=Hymenoscyphus albidus TaxID=595503 RepID=A0A9N9LZH3_9HELO|nr:hypothetical protein HYALB_00006881 [Hymenoscyphus albidus]